MRKRSREFGHQDASDAALIAAAPDLLAGLIAFEEAWAKTPNLPSTPLLDEAAYNAAIAIAKAEGQS